MRDRIRSEPRFPQCRMNKKMSAAGECMSSGMDMTLVFYVEALDDPLQIGSKQRFGLMSCILWRHLQYQ
jgi:hypothetical protein